MYTRTDNPLHILQEVIDNAADEALAGYAKNIDVVLHTDNSISITDDGRGIPVGNHPKENLPVVELVFTKLHAGGKFNKSNDAVYAFSGGLHGVGVAVTNALSQRLELTVWRDGGEYKIVFSDGLVTESLQKITNVAKRRTGTRVRVWPDGKYFDSANVPLAGLEHSLQSKAVLLSGIKVTLKQESTGLTKEWLYESGLRGYLSEALCDAELLVPIFEGQQYAKSDDDQFAPGEGAQWVVAWTQEAAVVRESYVNLIATPSGGTHESGLRDGLFNAVKSFIQLHSLLPKGIRLLPDDVFSRASFVLSAKVLDPQFQGQIKERLNSRDAVRLVSSYVRNALELWLNANVEYGKKSRCWLLAKHRLEPKRHVK